MLAAIVLPSIVQVALRRAPEPPAIERGEDRAYDLKIDLNACNRLELEHLPGVGPKLAERIIASRDADGPFASPKELLRVKGIGPKLLAKMQPYLAFPPDEEPRTTVDDPSSGARGSSSRSSVGRPEGAR